MRRRSRRGTGTSRRRRRDRRHARGHRDRNREHVVREEGHAGELGGQQPEVVLRDDVGAAGARIGPDRLAVREEEDREHGQDAKVIGITSEKARLPTAGTATFRISSVAYAEEDRLSLANTARAVGLPSRSCWSCAVGSAGPSTSRFHRCTGPRVEGCVWCGRLGRARAAAFRAVEAWWPRCPPRHSKRRPGRVNDA